MFQQDINLDSLTCPDCGGQLSFELDLLFCKEHGAFFAYGPHLLVRAPRPATQPSEVQLPWEDSQPARI